MDIETANLPVIAVTPEVIQEKLVVDGASLDFSEVASQLREALELPEEFYHGKIVKIIVEPTVVPVKYAVVPKVYISVSCDKS